VAVTMLGGQRCGEGGRSATRGTKDMDAIRHLHSCLSF